MSETEDRIVRMCYLMTKAMIARGVRRRLRFERRQRIMRQQIAKLHALRKSRLLEDRMFFMNLLTCWTQANTFRRDLKQYELNWWEDIVMAKFDDGQWRRHFRMSKRTFMSIVQDIGQYLSTSDASLSPDKQSGIAIYSMAIGRYRSSVACLFHVSKPVVLKSIQCVCDAMIRVYLPKYIQVPKDVILEDYLEKFESSWKFPQCAGVLGSMHVWVSKCHLPENASDYINNRNTHSMILQAVVGPSYCFWDINIGWPGSVTESKVFTSSALWLKGQDGELFPDRSKTLSEVEIPVLILAGSSYPLTDWVMKPYHCGEQYQEDVVKYNGRFSFAYSCIEVAFERLRARWACLASNSSICSIDILPNLATACCILHNICENMKEPVYDEWLSRAKKFKQPHSSLCNSVIGVQGEKIRDAIKEHFQKSST